MVKPTLTGQRVCDSCLDTGYEESNELTHGVLALFNADIEGDIEPEKGEIAQLMIDIGGHMVDHLCDQIESGGEIRCNCGCRS